MFSNIYNEFFSRRSVVNWITSTYCVMCLFLCMVRGKVKIKFTLEISMKAQGGVQVYLYSFFNLGTCWRWVLNFTQRPLYPRERPGTPCIGGWIGPRAGPNGCGKSRPPQPGFDPRIVQPVASHYTDWDIQAHFFVWWVILWKTDKIRIVLSCKLDGYITPIRNKTGFILWK